MAQAPFPITSAPLTAIALNYAGINRTARGYVADMVAPRIRVPDQLFRWSRSSIAEAFTQYDSQIDRLGKANEILQSWTEDTAQTVDYALRQPVPYRDEASARAQSIPFNLKVQAVRNVIDKVQLNREIRVAALCNTIGNYSAGYTDDMTSETTLKWSALATSDPVADIIDAAAGMLIPPTVGVTSRKVMNILKRHPKVSVALGGSQDSGRYVPDQEIATLLGLEKIIVGNTLKQTSKRGQTVATGAIWGDHFALHYQGATGPDGMGMDMASPNFLTTFQWNDMVSSETEFAPGDMGLYGGIKVLTGESVVEKQVAPFAGYFFQSVL